MRFPCVITVFAFITVACLAHHLLAAEPYDTSRWVGSNYTPAGCVNAVQLWHEFPAEVIDRELAAAKKHFGITTLRVYLHNIPYDAEKDQFLERIAAFLAICDRHGIQPGFVFFDDCWNHKGITLDSPPPVKGRHNGRWAACPQDVDRTEAKLPELKQYVQDVIRAHRRD
ncbi:MAG: glycoside hydrolase 5 family protein, partial [Planctomycetota bacterium]